MATTGSLGKAETKLTSACLNCCNSLSIHSHPLISIFLFIYYVLCKLKVTDTPKIFDSYATEIYKILLLGCIFKWAQFSLF